MQGIWKNIRNYLRRDERLALHLVLTLVMGYLFLTVFVEHLPLTEADRD